MERRGSGFKKIKADYHRAVNFREALEPQFYSDRTNFIVTLFNLNYGVEVGKTGKQENRKTGNQKGAVPQWIQGLPYKQPTLEKITLPLFRYVLTSPNPSPSKPFFNSAIGTLFFPLILTPRKSAIYLFIFTGSFPFSYLATFLNPRWKRPSVWTLLPSSCRCSENV